MNFCLKEQSLWDIEIDTWAVNSAGECYLHTVEVTGSIPVPPTNNIKGLRVHDVTPSFSVAAGCGGFDNFNVNFSSILFAAAS